MVSWFDELVVILLLRLEGVEISVVLLTKTSMFPDSSEA
jgi:hypothetical protein